MDVSNKTRPVDKYSQNSMLPPAVLKSLDKPSFSCSLDADKTERLRMSIMDTARKIADDIDKFLASEAVRLDFSIDKHAGEITIRIVHKDSDRIVREITEKMISGGADMIDETV